MKLLVTSIVFFLSALPVFSQVTLPKEIQGQPGQFIAITAETKSPGVYFYPISQGLSVFPPALLKDPKTTVVSANAPGRYKLIAWDGPTAPAETTVIIGDAPTPDPNPKPNPDPKPDPTPTPSKLWILVVEETTEAANNRGDFFINRELISRIRDKGHKWRVVDKDVRDREGKVPPDLDPYFQRAKGKTLPRLFLVTPEGRIRFEGDLPATPKLLLETLEKAGG